MIHVVTEWLHGARIPFSALEEHRAVFAEAVEAVRHAEVGLDGEPLTRDSDDTPPVCAIGGLVGSAMLIMVTAISCYIEPPQVGTAHPPDAPHPLRDKIRFAEWELQQALDCLVRLEALKQYPSFGPFHEALILGQERLSTI